MRSPPASAPPIISSRALTARSTSSAFRCPWRWVRISISSDLVMPVPGTCASPAERRPGVLPGRRLVLPLPRLLGLAVELLAQQRAELGGAAGGVGGGLVVLGQRFLGVGFVLGLDRELHQAALAIGADDLGLDIIAHLEVVRGVVHAIARDVAGGDVAFHAALELDGGALGVDFLHLAADDGTTGVARHVGAHRILLELLDAQADALAFRIDRQHDRFQRVALLVVAGDVLAGRVPADVGQVDQTVDAAVQADEDAEVGDRLDLARHLVVLLVDRGEGLPRIAGDLLDAERDAATLLVHVQHHDLQLVTDLHDLGRVDVLVGPVHFGHVDQAFDARLDLDERAVIGDVGDLAEHAGVGRVATRDVVPRILAHLLEAEADAVALLVVLEHADVEFLAEVDERAVVGEVLDHTLQHRALDELLEQLLALFRMLALDHRATRNHHVVALAVELDELELEFLAFEIDRVAD